MKQAKKIKDNTFYFSKWMNFPPEECFRWITYMCMCHIAVWNVKYFIHCLKEFLVNQQSYDVCEQCKHKEINLWIVGAWVIKVVCKQLQLEPIHELA